MCANTPTSNAKLETLKKRGEFVALRKARRTNTPGFILQKGVAEVATGPRFGFTVTKKTGNSVVRNRIKRKLREAAKICIARHKLLAGDHVLIGKTAALHLEFAHLVSDLSKALDPSAPVRANPRRNGNSEKAGGNSPNADRQ